VAPTYELSVSATLEEARAGVNALIKNARKLPQELYKSLTWDRGTEARSQAIHGRHRHPGLLLRSAKPMAAREQREHERAAQAVHAQGNGYLGFLTASAQRDCKTIEWKAAQDARLPYTR